MTATDTPLDLRDRILKEREFGNIVFWGLPNQLCVANLDDFIKQPADGMLYDLNRLEEISLTFLSDPKWVNDFAVALVIRRLAERLHQLEQAMKNAPHDVMCDSVDHDGEPIFFPCNCWKAALARKEG